MHARVLAYALVGLLAPAVAGAAETPGDMPPRDATPDQGGVLSDAEIVGILHTANLAEIATGEQARRKGESRAVKDFGARMVAEHSALDEQLLALANQLGVAPASSQVSEWLQATADHLQTATEPYTGASYDVLYIDGQLYLHSTLVGLADWPSTEAESPELRAALLAARRGILEHLDAASAVRQGLGDPPAAFTK